jgi:hypothetical protein
MKISQNDVNSRRKSTVDDKRKYPVGDSVEVFFIKEFELVFGYRKQRSRNAVFGFSSINGLPFDNFAYVEDLEDSLTFWGVSRSGCETITDVQRNFHVPAQGFAALTFGISTPQLKLKSPVYAGDTLVWCLPDLKEAKEMIQFMSTNSEPQKKLTPLCHPLDYSWLDHYLSNAAAMLFHPKVSMGIMDRLGKSGPGNTYDSDATKGSHPSKIQVPLALGKHALVATAKAVEVLNNRGIVEIVTPHKKKKRAAWAKLMQTLVKGYNASGPAFQIDPHGGRPAGLTRGIDDVGDALSDYWDAVESPKTNATTGTNTNLGKSFTESYAYFTHGRDTVDREEVYGRGEFPRTVDFATDESASQALRDHQRDKMHETLFLADVFGITNGGSGAQPTVISDVWRATHLAYADPDVVRLYATGKAIPDLETELEMAADPRLQYNLTVFHEASKNHLFDLDVALADGRDRIQKKIVGKALSYGDNQRPLCPVDVAVGLAKP